jgi:hypothetical protein
MYAKLGKLSPGKLCIKNVSLFIPKKEVGHKEDG